MNFFYKYKKSLISKAVNSIEYKLLYYKGQFIDEASVNGATSPRNELSLKIKNNIIQRSILREKNIIRSILEEPSFVDDMDQKKNHPLEKDATIILENATENINIENIDFNKQPMSTPNKSRFISIPTTDSEDDTPR